jgi:replicative DNA helicase
MAEVIVAKHRNGPTDSMKLSFLKRYAKFSTSRRPEGWCQQHVG